MATRIQRIQKRVCRRASPPSSQRGRFFRLPAHLLLLTAASAPTASPASSRTRAEKAAAGAGAPGGLKDRKSSRERLQGAEGGVARAPLDPPEVRHQVALMFDEWMRVCAAGGTAGGALPTAVPAGPAHSSEAKAYAPYLAQFQNAVVKGGDEAVERFFRNAAELAVEAALVGAPGGGPNYVPVDALAKLVVLLVKYGQGPDAGAPPRVAFLVKVLSTISRGVARDAEGRGKAFNQRPWFRLLADLIADLNTPDLVLEASNFQILPPGRGEPGCQPRAQAPPMRLDASKAPELLASRPRD
eukprot:tig00000767_g3964.t1